MRIKSIIFGAVALIMSTMVAFAGAEDHIPEGYVNIGANCLPLPMPSVQESALFVLNENKPHFQSGRLEFIGMHEVGEEPNITEIVLVARDTKEDVLVTLTVTEEFLCFEGWREGDKS